MVTSGRRFFRSGGYWFVNICEYSRWADVTSIRSTGFDSVSAALDNLFAKLGTPTTYKTDNGPPFQSHNFSDFARRLGFKHQKITPLWPRANAEAERFMQNLGKVLKSADISKSPADVALGQFLRAYRETPHSTTGVPPAILMMGWSRTTGIPQIMQTGDVMREAISDYCMLLCRSSFVHSPPPSL